MDNTWTAHGHFASTQAFEATLSPGDQRVATDSPERCHGTHAPREDLAEAASQEGAQTPRSGVQDATTIAAGAAHLSKHRDVLRPGDITTDYAASAWRTTVARTHRKRTVAQPLRVIARYVVRAAIAPRTHHTPAERSAVALREWGWGKCKNNEAACSVGRSRMLQARPNNCMRCCGCRPSQGTSRA